MSEHECGLCSEPAGPGLCAACQWERDKNELHKRETVHTALGDLVAKLWQAGDRSDTLMRAALCFEVYTQGRCVDFLPTSPAQDEARKAWRKAMHKEINSIGSECVLVALEAVDAALEWLRERTTT